jgi:hypothetical protein
MLWVDVFGQTSMRFNWVCHVRCQMTNHYAHKFGFTLSVLSGILQAQGFGAVAGKHRPGHTICGEWRQRAIKAMLKIETWRVDICWRSGAVEGL